MGEQVSGPVEDNSPLFKDLGVYQRAGVGVGGRGVCLLSLLTAQVLEYLP